MVIRLKIIYDNLLNNIETIRNYFIDRKIYAVVKSDAYNHGIKEVVSLMLNCSIYDYCVSNIKEAIELRKIDKNINILLLGRMYENDIVDYIDYNIIVSLSNIDDYRYIIENKLYYQLCVNTGMNRYGLSIYEAKAIISKNDNLLKGIYTHLGSADVKDKRYYRQCSLFRELVDNTDVSDIDIHISNSSDSLDISNDYNAIRIGMLFYNGIDNNLGLLNTVSIKGKIIDIKYVKSHDYVGYYKTKMLKSNKYIGIINVGYESGILNCFKIRYVVINNRLYKVVGKICMNNMFVIVDSYVKINDTVELIGNYNGINSISKLSGISAYEILLNLKK